MAVGVPVALVAFDMSAAGTGAWQAKTAYTAGQTIVDPDGYLQTATTTGTSGTAQPVVWNDTAGKATQTERSYGRMEAFPGDCFSPIARRVGTLAGGLPRRQPVLPVARIAQLSEQLSEQLALQPGFSDLASIAALLPPKRRAAGSGDGFPAHEEPLAPQHLGYLGSPGTG